jgi:hypothetical protein
METLYSLESSLGASGEKMKRSSGKETNSFPSFMEYMNAKGKMVEKPEIETVPDYHGPDDKFPSNSKVPYKTPVANKKPAAGESGLSELGDGKLKYEPMKRSSNYEVKKDVMKEYMDDKGKVLERGREDVKGEYKGKTPNCPPGSNSKPYISSAIKPGEKGLGEVGDKELVYEPDTEKSPKIKTKTEGFLNKTKGMSLSEFTKYMLKECGCGQVEGDDLPYVTAYTSGKFQPHPPEVIRYISILADKNDGILQNLVGQMISMGYLGKLLKAIFEHPQAYEELVSLFGDENGPSRCKSFAGAMNNSYDKFISDQESMYESVSSPIGFEDEMGEEGEKRRMHGHEDFEDEDSEDSDSDFEDEDSEDSDFENEDEDSEDSDFENEDEDEDSDFEDEEDSEESDFEDEEDSEESDFEDEDEGKFEDESDEYGDEMRPKSKKLKKKFAHDNLLDAMRNHEHMFKKMRGI